VATGGGRLDDDDDDEDEDDEDDEDYDSLDEESAKGKGSRKDAWLEYDPVDASELQGPKRWLADLETEIVEATEIITKLRTDHARVCLEKADMSIVVRQAELVDRLVKQSTEQAEQLIYVNKSLQETNLSAKAIESAIGQAFKLLQAQVLSKASRRELHEALAKALDTSLDSQERLRMISSSLESLSEEVKTRASNEHVAELQKVLGKMRHLQEHGGANKRQAQDDPLMPSMCLACNQALPLKKKALPSHIIDLGAPAQMRGKSAGQLRGKAAERARLLFGREPENAQRRQTAQQLRDMAASTIDDLPSVTQSLPTSPGESARNLAGAMRPDSAALQVRRMSG